MTDHREQLGEAIRRTRKALGMTQLELSEKAGLSRPAIGGIEAGRKALPADKLQAIADALKVPASYLLDEPSENERLSIELLTAVRERQANMSQTLLMAGQLVTTLANESEAIVAMIAKLNNTHARDAECRPKPVEPDLGGDHRGY